MLAEFAAILGKHTLAAHYSALATRLWSEFNSVYLARRTPPAPARAVTCGESQEMKKGGHELVVGCPSGATVSAVLFAAFGTPSGACTSGFEHNSTCDAAGAEPGR